MRSVDLRAELAVLHHLKERMLRRRSDEPGAALRILPDDGDIAAKSRRARPRLGAQRRSRFSLSASASRMRNRETRPARAAPRIFRWATGIVLFSLGMIRKLRKLLDAEFYLRANPDVAAARMDPLKHYVKYGAAEQRQPHPLFDPVHYWHVARRRATRKIRCCIFWNEPETSGGKWPSTHPLFDCEAYVSAHPSAAGNPLVALSRRKSARRSGRKPVRAMLKEAADVRFVLLHYHFFKNAGTTVEEILENSFFENYARLDSERFRRRREPAGSGFVSDSPPSHEGRVQPSVPVSGSASARIHLLRFVFSARSDRPHPVHVRLLPREAGAGRAGQRPGARAIHRRIHRRAGGTPYLPGQ